MASNDSAIGSGGLGGSAAPWTPPRGGGEGTGSMPAGSLGPEPSKLPTPQGGGAVIGGGIGWPGNMKPMWVSTSKQIFGGLGDRGGSSPR